VIVCTMLWKSFHPWITLALVLKDTTIVMSFSGR
jgi:hypothetical protein